MKLIKGDKLLFWLASHTDIVLHSAQAFIDRTNKAIPDQRLYDCLINGKIKSIDKKFWDSTHVVKSGLDQAQMLVFNR